MNTPNKITAFIYQLLARRDYSSARIEQKLLRKGFPLAELKPILETLLQEGTLSDHRFAENYIRYRQNRGFGPLRIQKELEAEGLSKEVIEDHLKIADNVWLVEAARVWQKRFHGKPPVNLKERGRQLRFLQYRGFTQEQIEPIFDS